MKASARPFDRDRLALVSRDAATKLAFRALQANEQDPPEQQVAAVAVLFAAYVSRLRLDPESMHAMGLKILKAEPFMQKGNVWADTLTDFARLRLNGDQGVEVR